MPELVGPVIVLVVLFFALLIAYPWELLTAGTLAFLASLPFGWMSYRGYERRSREGHAEAAAPVAPPLVASRLRSGDDNDNDERSSRLN
jgi:CDP-diacylglycerol--serine O-phosphatidyltransferase